MWFVKPKIDPAFVCHMIMLPCDDGVPIPGIKGISLRIVPRQVYDQHMGLKYWVSSETKGLERCSEVQQEIGLRARLDLLDLSFFKRPVRYEGLWVDSARHIYAFKKRRKVAL